MTAQEMFKEVKYYLLDNNEDKIIYKNGEENTTIEFYKSVFKRYTVTNGRGESRLISPMLHKAIHKQIEELGW